MKAFKVVVFLLCLCLVLASCAPGPNEMVGTPDAKGTVAGFWYGLWHGLISPVTFVISLFNHNVQLYDAHNNGGWYNFGFILGVSIVFSGSAGGASRARRRS